MTRTTILSVAAVSAASLLFVAGCGGSKTEAESPDAATEEPAAEAADEPKEEAADEPKEEKEQKTAKERVPEVEETIAAFKEKDPDIEAFFGKSAGYVVIPTVGVGAAGIGGGWGKGELFEAGAYSGMVKITQFSLGAQLGGKSYSQLVFFEDADTMQKLKDGTFEFGAGVSAIAADKGAALGAAFKDGVVAFSIGKGGLMAAANIGGQNMKYLPKE